MIDLPIGTLLQVVENDNCETCIFSQSCKYTEKLICNLIGKKDDKLIKIIKINQPYNSDLSKIQIGDYVWSIRWGWCVIKEIHPTGDYPIIVDTPKLFESITKDGFCHIDDKFPSIFLAPPVGFKDISKPEPNFRPGEKVYGKQNKSCARTKCYFESYDFNNQIYTCYIGDEWTGKTYFKFKYIEKVEK